MQLTSATSSLTVTRTSGPQFWPCERLNRTDPQLTVWNPLLPPAGPQAQGWTGKCRGIHCECLVGVGIHPLAIGQDRS